MDSNIRMDFDSNEAFVPTEADKEFERRFITAPSLTEKNGKWYEALERMSENSIKAFLEGRVEDVEKVDRIWIPKTYQMYRNGARAIMGALRKEKEIH